MTTHICGHDRKTLQWALRIETAPNPIAFLASAENVAPYDVYEDAHDIDRVGTECINAQLAVRDTAEIVNITTALLREHGFDAWRTTRTTFQQGAPRVPFLLLWEPGEDTIDIWDGKKWRNHRSTQQIRTLALMLLNVPATTPIAVDRIVGALG